MAANIIHFIVWRSTLFLYFPVKSGFDIFNYRGKFCNSVSYASWSECYLILLIAMEVVYCLFSEEYRALVFLRLHNYFVIKTADSL